MRHRIPAVLLLLVLSSLADRTNERNQNPEVRLQRNESEERTSGRRWTTSQNSPYQKIVSSYEQLVPDLREAGSEQVETNTSKVPDEAKAKSQKRKQWRTSASSHDQIPSEASFDGESQKAEPEKPATEATDPRAQKVQANQNLSGSSSRRRSASSHPRELASDSYVELSTSNPKKRRRPVATSITTSTLAPQTMSDSLYQYFRPIDQDVPQDDIIPFLDFGRKLSPVLPTPSGANSIDNKSTFTKLKSRSRHEEKESNSSDEELLQEDMDVTVVKKAIERNSVPRGKIYVREQGISDYYKKRIPSQIRTTENLISTDSSTASSVSGSKNIGLNKKINRHQVHHVEPHKIQGQLPQRFSIESKNSHELKDVEIVQQKRRQFLSRPIQRSAALKQETPNSPLTAESSLVKTIIKESPVHISMERLSRNPIRPLVINANSSLINNSADQPEPSMTHQSNATSPVQDKPNVNSTETKSNPKILSTAVVTSVSVEESLQESKHRSTTESPVKVNIITNPTIHLNKISMNNTVSRNSSEPPPLRHFVSLKRLTNNTSKNVSDTFSNTSSSPIVTKLLTAKNDTLRSREIYRPKAVPPGIPHLPRQIPLRNATSKIMNVLETKSTSENLDERTTVSVVNVTNSISTTASAQQPLITITSTPPSTTVQTPTTTQKSTTTLPRISSIASTTLPEVITSRSDNNITEKATEANLDMTTPVSSKSVEELTSLKKIYESNATPVSPKSEEELTSLKEIDASNRTQVSPKSVEELTPLKEIDESNTTPESPKSEEELTSLKEINESTATGTSTTEAEDTSRADVTTADMSVFDGEETTTLHKPSHAGEESILTIETESIPHPKVEISSQNPIKAPAYPPDEEVEDRFHIYFTTLPTTSTVPITDTRPETEAAVVEEQKNLTSPRAGEEWVKVGAVDKDVEVVYPDTLGLGAYLLAALGVVPIILGALIGTRFIMAHNKKKVLDESEYSSEYNRSPLGISSASPLPTKLPRIPTHVSWSGGGGAGGGDSEKSVISPVTLPSTSASPRWEFPREKLRLQTLLGQGNFGQVWKAEADDIAGHEGLTRLVAVKTVKESVNAREREDLLRELGIMQELGSHPNVVTLLGCCTEKEPIYLVMEYVMYGKLLSFLRDHRTRAHYYNFSDAGDALTSRDLTVFAYCVARGMDYLTNKSIIHRDLAARNVLVDHNKLCKIADFGMSRNVRDTGQIYEQRQSKGALPIRWMAPESLHFSLFTHKTDVWSFGILLWEIVTLGSTPYATMGAREVMRRVRDGYRLDRPSHCRSELFRVIAQCWHSEPVKRPSFAELKIELGQLLSDSELNGSYVDLDSFADEMRRDTLHRHHH